MCFNAYVHVTTDRPKRKVTSNTVSVTMDSSMHVRLYTVDICLHSRERVRERKRDR